MLYTKRLIRSIKKLPFILFTLLIIFALAPMAQARDASNITDWYIKDFQSQIVVNKDSSLDITENITADCGDLPDKHGIFRVLPTQSQVSGSEIIKSPTTLINISDFNNNPINYTTINNRSDHTITWKIGDAYKTVTGVNYYKIHYIVKNAVRHNSSDFDELYWNLSGNFWDIEIDSFHAVVTFPSGITKDNSKLNIYSGAEGDKNTLEPQATFNDQNQLEVSYDKTMTVGQGLTASITFPKGIVAPYVPTFWEKYGSYFYILIPLLVLWLCIMLWRKYGRDPKINPTIVPEFEIPEKLAPIEMGILYSDGILKNNYISASIINLAVHGFLKIEQITVGSVFKSKDYVLTRLEGKKYTPSAAEQVLLDALFAAGDQIKMSELKNKFYTNLPSISRSAKEYLIGKQWLVSYSRTFQYLFIFFAIAFGALTVALGAYDPILAVSLGVSAVVTFIFSFLMTVRPLEGAKLYKRVQGFRMYMDKAEKYRSQFNEKENIFEQFLPYAIMFEMTKEWIKKMRSIYGEEYFASYHPIWFYGALMTDFNVDSFSSELNNMTSSMASTIASNPSSSGSGGGGFSGGGGGGGGGGGW